jgi:hypothetical protein
MRYLVLSVILLAACTSTVHPPPIPTSSYTPAPTTTHTPVLLPTPTPRTTPGTPVVEVTPLGQVMCVVECAYAAECPYYYESWAALLAGKGAGYLPNDSVVLVYGSGLWHNLRICYILIDDQSYLMNCAPLRAQEEFQ